MLSRLRAYLANLYPDLYTEDGFRLSKRLYSPPEITARHAGKKTMTICDLFSNHHKSIDEVAKLLDTSRAAVISTLIAAKKTITICDLFSNQHKSIDEVAKLLDASRGAVISTLIEEGIILDRRRSQRNTTESGDAHDQDNQG